MKPIRKECKCQSMVKCQCEGWNEAYDVWDAFHKQALEENNAKWNQIVVDLKKEPRNV